MVRFIDLLRGTFFSDNRGRRRRAPARILSFESLETRTMFATTAGALISPGTPDAVVAPTVPATTTSLWTNSALPGTVDTNDGAAVNLGIRFTADTNGYITGLKFYKSAANTGVHTASLWTSSGQLLATTVFTNESSSGWQQVNFSSPVAITAGTTYVASYFAPRGHYSVNRNAFASGFTSGHLQILPNGGVFQYGSGSAYPAQTYMGSNYWVDVLLSVTPPVDTTAPTVTSTNPANGASSVATSSAMTVYFSEGLNSATVNTNTIQLLDGGVQAAASVAYSAANNSVTITPSAGAE